MKRVGLGLGAVILVGAGVGLWFILKEAPPTDGPVSAAPDSVPAPGSPGPAPSAPAPATPGTGEPTDTNSLPVAPTFYSDSRTTQVRHWFLELGPEGLGLSRQDWIRLRATTPFLGVPKSGENPRVLAAFDYVTVERPVGKTSEDNLERARQLLAEAKRQKLPTLAHMMALSRDIDLVEKGSVNDKSPLEFLIPVAPNTKVEPPLVLRHIPEMRVFVMERAAVVTELGKAVQALAQQARSRGFRIVAPLIGYYDGEDWPVLLEKGEGEKIRVYLAVEGGG